MEHLDFSLFFCTNFFNIYSSTFTVNQEEHASESSIHKTQKETMQGILYYGWKTELP